MSITLVEKARAGMGAILHESGVAFRGWAPHADAVFVAGSFNDWSTDAHPMERDVDGLRLDMTLFMRNVRGDGEHLLRG